MSRSVAWLWLVGAVIVAAPLAMLFDLNAVFGRDWNNNLWMISYSREYLSAHGQFPDEFNVALHVGVPLPVFYGPLLYPILTLLSVPLGAGLALRVACFGLWSLQFWLVYRLSRAVKATIGEAVAAGALLSWSIYSLTDLYNRAALAEFFATGFLLCAVAAGGLAVLEPTKRRRPAFALLFALGCAMAFGSHAPTALIGGPMLLIAALCALRFDPGRAKARVAAMAALAAVVVCILLPWALMIHRYSGHLTIQTPGDPLYPVAGHWQPIPAVDSWPARLSPLPIPESWKAGAHQKPGTPHLDAQWNFPLVALAVWNLALLGRSTGRRPVMPLILFCCAAGVALLCVSIAPALQNLLPPPLPGAIQFPYRLVSHVNLAGFILLIAAWMARGGAAASPRWLLAAVLIISGAGMALKLAYGGASSSLEDDLTQLPTTFAGQDDYSVQIPQRLVPETERSGAMLLDAPGGVGPDHDVVSTTLDFPASTWAVTSVLNFPWNRLILDGRAVPFEDVHNLGFHEAVRVSPGAHSFGFRFEPDVAWERLNVISRAGLVLLLIATVISFLFLR